MEETYQRNDRDQEKEESRGTVTIPYLKNCVQTIQTDRQSTLFPSSIQTWKKTERD